ncbi:MAG: hypothetical protein R2748_13790 [Bryobacterales bacterium]
MLVADQMEIKGPLPEYFDQLLEISVISPESFFDDRRGRCDHQQTLIALTHEEKSG